eukprot:scaffold92121_cov39-Attheya_sp.AAC.1
MFAITVGIAGAAVAADIPGAGETCSIENQNEDCVCVDNFSQDENGCVSHDRTVVDKRFYS